ncbi:TetR family transcriptional regulator [Gordonia malaquae]|uniref:TetR family transcriptional regulator n=1 Tax=Gordonia malaquae TaxID=410332 RepID=UPI0030C79062
MPPDATLTKQRILEGARTEFAAYGLAGARIDRIAEKAEVNKRSIYAHFGPKEELFDLVVSTSLATMADAVQFTEDDLAGYAVRLFDYLRAEPSTLRLTTWANLERPTTTPSEHLTYQTKVAALASRFERHATDVLAMTLGLVTSWASSSPALIATAGPGGVWTDERRDMLSSGVAALERKFEVRS